RTDPRHPAPAPAHHHRLEFDLPLSRAARIRHAIGVGRRCRTAGGALRRSRGLQRRARQPSRGRPLPADAVWPLARLLDRRRACDGRHHARHRHARRESSCRASKTRERAGRKSFSGAFRAVMKALIVVNRPEDWPHEIPGAAVTTAKSYLTGPAANNDQYRQVLNLCRCARADDAGFYVSLLAEARGQRPLPTAKALEDLHAHPANAPAVREIEALAAQSAPAGKALEIEVYFGADAKSERDALAERLFAHAKAPLLRATLRRRRSGWRLQKVRMLSVADIAPENR